MLNKKIPLIGNGHEKIVCTVCLLPMQYQSKKHNSFIWQCFKCGKKYFVKNIDGKYTIEESWSSSK